MKSDWPLVAIRNLVQQVEQSVKPQRATTYRLLGVRWYGLGPFVREEVTTTTSKATRLFPVQPGQFVYNRLFAWKGSFGVISADHKGCHVSGEFPLFEVDTTHILVDYLFLYMNRPTIWESIEIESTGSTSVSRNRWKEERFLGWKIRLPSVPVQRRIVDLVSSVDSYIAALQQQADAARVARAAVLSELLSAGGEDWTETALGDIADVLDRMRKPISAAEREGRIGEVPYYGATGQAGWIDKPLFDEELVLLGEDAIDFLNPDVHKAYLISGPSWVNNHAHVLRAKKEKVVSFFLMEALNAVDYSQFVSFGTRSKLTQGAMMKISVQVPPLAEQEQIVKTISAIDELIKRTESTVSAARSLRSGLLSDLLSGSHEIPESYDRLLGVA